jgi:hypothetical protein
MSERAVVLYFKYICQISFHQLTQPPVQWVPGVLSLGVKRGRGLTLTIHSHLVNKS